MDYKEKLKDPRWQKKKAEITMRDNFTCQQCGATDKTLEVHHKTYDNCKDGNPWSCPDEDLITYCHDCHYSYHFKDKLDSMEYWYKEGFWAFSQAFSLYLREKDKKIEEELLKRLREDWGIVVKDKHAWLFPDLVYSSADRWNAKYAEKE